ncbi:hypothetical protein DFS34DRAFT_637269 [Phlyctochytrium arcticum]|nr:hypothetical protein DFS34DRAFT_637269 [Phlyctochytrium arcticum]
MHGFDDDAINVSTLDFPFDDASEPQTNSGKKSLRKQYALQILDIPQQDLPVPASYDCLHCQPIEKLALLPNPVRREGQYSHSHQLCWQVMLWCKVSGLSFDNYWSWCRQKDPVATRYKKYFDAWSAAEKYDVQPGFLDVLLERYYPRVYVSPATQRLEEQFNIRNTKYAKVSKRPFVQAVDISPPETPAGKRQRLEDRQVASTSVEPPATNDVRRYYAPKKAGKVHKFSILNPPMGRNKTGAVIDYIARYGQGWRVGWLAPRITLAENTLSRLQAAGLKVVNYKELTKEQLKQGAMDSADFVICSIQSLHHTSKPFDLVVLDESETIFSSFRGNADTYWHVDKFGFVQSNLDKNWHTLLSHMETPRKVILMDAFTTDLTTNFVRGIIRQHDAHVGDNYEVIDSPEPATPRKFMEVTGFNDWLLAIINAAKKGEKLYIFTPYKAGKKGVDMIVKSLVEQMGWEEGRHIIGYFAEKEKEKKSLSQVGSVWGDPEFRCVVTNGCISVGVNFNTPNVFDRIFAYYAPFTQVRDCLQAVFRIRHPKSDTMILCREATRTFGFSRDPRVRHPDCSIYQQLQKDLQIESEANDNTKNWETFNLFCKIANITLVPATPDMVDSTNKEYLESLAKKCDLVFCWDQIADLSPDDAKAAQLRVYNGQGTVDDRLQLDKFFFRRKFIPSASETPEGNSALGDMWNTKQDFVDRVVQLWTEGDDNFINQILKQNKVSLGDSLPERMRHSLSLDAIKARYHFDRRIQNTQTGVISQIFNAHFGMQVYHWKKRKREDGKLLYEYVTSDLYMRLCKDCILYSVNSPINQPKEEDGVEPINILDIMDSLV